MFKGDKVLDFAEKSYSKFYVNGGFMVVSRRLLAIRETPTCKVVWARLGNLYGGDLHGNLVDFTLGKIAKGERADFGPASQPYDFVHVDDAIRALVLLGTSAEDVQGAYYVGSGRCDVLADWLREIGRIAGKPELIGIGRRPDDGTRYRAEWFSIDALKRLGYLPQVPFVKGMAELIAEASR